ncbi:MAG: hypothetical protein ACI4K5_06195 [Ruminococcus sp.]
MIKGVNKKIIEINNPESIYFEKAVFYLRPEVMELPQQVAEDEIERYISRLGISSHRRKSKNRYLIITLTLSTLFFFGVMIFCLV